MNMKLHNVLGSLKYEILNYNTLTRNTSINSNFRMQERKKKATTANFIKLHTYLNT